LGKNRRDLTKDFGHFLNEKYHEIWAKIEDLLYITVFIIYYRFYSLLPFLLYITVFS
jgi:hypothetical protein